MNPLRNIRTFLTRAAAIAALLASVSTASAVILFGTGDVNANRTAPGGTLAGSGWQFEGGWGSFLGTPVAPHFFLSAAHVGNAGNGTFSFNGQTFNVVRAIGDPAGSDLILWQVDGTFSTFAPLYTTGDEPGRPLLVIGCGTQRGADITLNGQLRGWADGPSDGKMRWGTNSVAEIVPQGAANSLLYATFDAGVSVNEAQLSSGDSGGATFIQAADGVWRLAGINYAVDGPFYTNSAGGGQFQGSLFDARGFYYSNGKTPPTYLLIDDPNAVPTGFYSTRIFGKVGWIYSITQPDADGDSDGSSNLLEYGLRTNPAVADAGNAPKIAREGNLLTLTYTRPTTATDLTYVVIKSPNLVDWEPAGAQETIVSTVGDIRTVKATVPIDGAPSLYLRLRVTRP